MHRITRALSLAMLSLALGTARPAAGAQSSDEQLAGEVDALAAMRLQEPGAVGFSVAVARGGRMLLAKGYGLADLEHDVAADAETSFRIGSVTKQFTAAAIMRLLEQGKLSLDDELTRYYPDYPTQGHTVTIRHLLTHTSGIKSYTGVGEFWETGAARDLSADELLAYVDDADFDFTPGQQFKYSNTGYYMLGAIIEQASGVPYCEYLQNEFFTRLGLGRTRCDSNADIIPNRAQGYGLEDGKLVNDGLISMSNAGAAGMIISTAHDLVTWGMALIGGEVVGAESLEQMITPIILPSGASTGYGFGLKRGETRGHRTIGHGGGVFGFSAMLVHVPDEDLHIAVIANVFGEGTAQLLARDIAAAAFGADESVADLTPSEEDVARFSGLYALEGMDREAKIFEQDGYLFMQPTGQRVTKLLYQGRGEFRVSHEPSIRIVFDPESGQDFVLHQGGGRVKGGRLSLVDLAPSADDVARFGGTYFLERFNIEAKIFEQDGRLFMQPAGRPPTRLLYQGEGEFRSSSDASIRIAFEAGHGPDLVLHQGGRKVKGSRRSDD
ncbi:MAG: serine hydrolase domain-containing protein [Gemmatimonadota bacterium]